jgi:EmrB/QacA subfamily drug resistance transporter
VERPRQHYNVTLGILTLAGIAFSLQQTMVFPALATFQRELHTTTAWVTWVLTGFLVAAAVTTPILGRLGDQFGKERMLLVSLGLFFVGSAAAAAAWNIWSLIGFRALAGAGGALFPLSFAIIRDEFPPEKAKVAYGLLSAVFGVGGGIGIVASGVIIDSVGWRWLFVVGAIPVGLSILLVWRYVPESPIKTPSRVDVPGAALLSGALVTLMLALTEGEDWGWTSARILALFAASAALFVTWGWWERRTRAPMVDMRMLAHRPVLLTNVVTLIAGFALFSCFVLVPTFVQAPSARGYGFGATATEVGLYLLPGAGALLFAGPVAGMMGRRVGSKWPLALGMAIVSLAALGLATTHDEPWQVITSYTLLCVGVGLAFAAMVALIAENVRETETGVATGMNTVVRMIGAVVGGQIGAALLTAQTLAQSSAPAERAFATAFGLSAVAGMIAALVALSITPGRRSRRREEVRLRSVA